MPTTPRPAMAAKALLFRFRPGKGRGAFSKGAFGARATSSRRVGAQTEPLFLNTSSVALIRKNANPSPRRQVCGGDGPPGRPPSHVLWKQR